MVGKLLCREAPGGEERKSIVADYESCSTPGCEGRVPWPKKGTNEIRQNECPNCAAVYDFHLGPGGAHGPVTRDLTQHKI
jgi:hypothetical protein